VLETPGKKKKPRAADVEPGFRKSGIEGGVINEIPTEKTLGREKRRQGINRFRVKGNECNPGEAAGTLSLSKGRGDGSQILGTFRGEEKAKEEIRLNNLGGEKGYVGGVTSEERVYTSLSQKKGSGDLHSSVIMEKRPFDWKDGDSCSRRRRGGLVAVKSRAGKFQHAQCDKKENKR